MSHSQPKKELKAQESDFLPVQMYYDIRLRDDNRPTLNVGENT